MFNLTINFGPAGTIWALLFETEEKAGEVYNAYVEHCINRHAENILIGVDDFGQSYAIPFDSIHAMLLEDLEQIEAARIQRALVDERCKAKFLKAASDDPAIRAAARASQGTPIMSPMGNRF